MIQHCIMINTAFLLHVEFFFFQAEDGIRDGHVTGVQTCALPILPTWRSWLPAGGSGLWIDTGTDAVALAQRALPLGIRLTAGPAFSPHDGHREFLRLPVWQPSGQFAKAMAVLAELSHHP